VVNRQYRTLSIWLVALGLNAVANALALWRGGGTVAVAWNDVWVQALVVAMMYSTARTSLRGFPRRAVVELGGLASLSVLVALALHGAESSTHSVGSQLLRLTVRVVAVTAVWAVAAALVRTRVRTAAP
jgi:hypothetical protein